MSYLLPDEKLRTRRICKVMYNITMDDRTWDGEDAERLVAEGRSMRWIVKTDPGFPTWLNAMIVAHRRVVRRVKQVLDETARDTISAGGQSRGNGRGTVGWMESHITEMRRGMLYLVDVARMTIDAGVAAGVSWNAESWHSAVERYLTFIDEDRLAELDAVAKYSSTWTKMGELHDRRMSLGCLRDKCFSRYQNVNERRMVVENERRGLRRRVVDAGNNKKRRKTKGSNT